MAELIRRLTVALVVLAGLLALPAAALADGRDILADFDDNGKIDGCYSVEEFNEALDLARDDERQYGAAVDIIMEAQVTNVEVEGEPCGAEVAAAVADDGDDGGGTSIALVIGIIAAAGAVGIGAALFVHQRSRRSAG